jgi:RHS repeat-associated protein
MTPVPFSTTYDYDPANNRTKVTDAVGNVTSYAYDKVGNLTSVTDPNVHSTQYEYDPVNRRTKVMDALGDVTSTSYDTAGDVTQVMDANTHPMTYGYDPDHHMVKATRVNSDGMNPFTEVTTYAYDNAGNLTKVIDANGHTTLYDYDGLNRRTKVTDARTYVSSTQYDKAGNVTATVDARGFSTTYFFDDANRLTKVQDPEGNVTSTLYDKAGNVTATADALRKTTAYDYDAANRRTLVTDPQTGITRTYYDAAGNVRAIYYPNNTNRRAERFRYDGNNRRISDLEERQDRQHTRYDPAGNVTKVSDGLRDVTAYRYDAANRRTKVIDGNGNSTSYAYDKVGNLTAVTDATGKTTSYGYDWANRQTSVTDRNGKVTTTLYDKVGNVLQVTGPNQDTMSYAYDDDNRRTLVKEGTLTGVTTTQYDQDGNVTSVQDPNGNLTQFAYNKDDLQTFLTDPYAHTVNYAYDADKRLTLVRDQLGRTRTFQYSENGWLLQEVRAGGAVPETLTYRYDPDGNQTFAGSSNGSAYTFAYDRIDRLTQIQEPFGLSLSYTYDNANRITAVNDSLMGATTSAYDRAGRLTSRRFSGLGLASLSLIIGWTPRNDVATLIYNSNWNGTGLVAVAAYDLYDNEQRLRHETVQAYLGATVGEYTYTYDAGGRLTGQTWAENQGMPVAAAYGYDAANHTNRLTTDSRGYLNNTYQYDDAGNRANAGFVPTTNNQLQADPLGYTYVYDAVGNVSQKLGASDSWSYTYDNVNHLASAKHFTGATQDLEVDYQYDALGQRIETDTTQNGTTTVERYAYDRGNVWADLDGSNALKARHFYRDGVDAVFAEIRYASNGVGTLYFEVTDRQGSVRELIDVNGMVTKVLDYDAYGAPISESNLALAERYRYTGREWDANTKLQYNRTRDYDPVAQRWLQQDTIGFQGGDANLYRYVHNGPTSYTDPSGRFGFIGGLIGGVLGGIVGGVSTYLSNPNATWTDIVVGAGKGALVGAVAGATGGLALGAATAAFGTGLGATVAAGALAGVAGDVAGQITGNTVGTQSGWNWQQTVGAAAGGAVFGPLATLFGGGSQAVQAAGGFTYRALVSAGVGSGLVGDAVAQGLDILSGKADAQGNPVGWSWGRFALAGGVGGLAGIAAKGLQETLPRSVTNFGSTQWFQENPRLNPFNRRPRLGLGMNLPLDGFDYVGPENDETPIYGQLRRTSSKTPGHAEVAENLADDRSTSGEYRGIHLGRSWAVATGGKVASRRAPDVLGIRKNGTIDVWEVESATDNAYDLFERARQVMVTLPRELQGTIKVLRPKGIIKDIKSSDNRGKYLGKTSADADRAFREQLPGFEVVDWQN